MSDSKVGRRKGKKKSRSGGNSTLTTVSTLGGFADRTRVKLRYVDNIAMSPSGVTASNYVFSGNGIFDPDVTSTGLQPCNFDDYAAQYSRYRVWGSKITYCVANSASGTLDLTSFVIGPRHVSTALTTQAAQENFQCQPYTQYFKSILYTNREAKYTCSMTTAKFLGLSQTEFAGNDDITSLVSAQPAHQWFWHIVGTSDDQSSSTTHYVNVCIDYDVEFWDRVEGTLDFKLDRIKAIREAKRQAEAVQKDAKEMVIEKSLDLCPRERRALRIRAQRLGLEPPPNLVDFEVIDRPTPPRAVVDVTYQQPFRNAHPNSTADRASRKA